MVTLTNSCIKILKKIPTSNYKKKEDQLKYNIQNYKFFKSYRFPIYESDKVNAEVITFERENVKHNNVRIDSINLSGLNFICNQKYSIGERVKVKIKTNRIFNNWDFELSGRIIRSFIYCEDVTKTIYGISIDPNSQTTVLKYFLKDFLSQYNSKKLKDKVFRICQNRVKISRDDGVELFSLFQSLIQKTILGELSSILKELPKIFHCENYHVLIYDAKNGDFQVDRKNCDYDLNTHSMQNILKESYFNKVIINKTFNEKSATGIDIEIKNILLAPVINYNGESIGLISLTNTYSGEKFNFTMIENIKIVSGLIAYFYQGNNVNSAESIENKIPENFIFSDRSQTGLSILNTLNTIKNTRENLYIRSEEGCGKIDYAKYLCGQPEDIKNIIDFKNVEDQNFEIINELSNQGINDLIVKNIEVLSLEKQGVFYNLVSALNIRIITISTTDLKALEKNDLILTDLYNLIATVKLNIPPLRLRKTEIIEVAKSYIRFECEKRDIPIKKLSQESINYLESAKWNYNNRKLHSILLKAVIKTDPSEQVIKIDVSEGQSDTIIKSDKNTQLQDYILNTLHSCDKSISYTNTERVFVENLMRKKAS